MLNLRNLPEVAFSSSDPSESRRISRLLGNGQLRKIAPRLYTSNLQDSAEAVVRRNRLSIIAHFFPGAVISHRTAFNGGGPLENEHVMFFTCPVERTVRLPGLTLRALKGPGPLPGDIALTDGLYLTSDARLLLENLQPARTRKTVAKTVSRDEVERRIERICQIRGEDELNVLRDQAREIAPLLGENEFARLDAIISAVLGTRSVDSLKTQALRARAAGQPFDAERVSLFELLCQTLRQEVLPDYAFEDSGERWVNAAFFDAYFSNYIEGTEFEPEEAAEIVFENRVLPDRPEDSHDILGTYRVVSNRADMACLPDSFEALERLLRDRHLSILSGRGAQVRPGQYKSRANRAGNTVFVAPELVRGTLHHGFGLYTTLRHPFARAAFIMYLVTEVHPFIDGNGRVARAMMNAELTATGQSRVLIPTVYREDYLQSLRNLSRNQEPGSLLRMLARAREFTARLDFGDLRSAMAQLKDCNAFANPSEAKLRPTLPDAAEMNSAQ